MLRERLPTTGCFLVWPLENPLKTSQRKVSQDSTLLEKEYKAKVLILQV
jgi:hypothetical protein